LKIYFLLGILKISNAHKRIFGGDDDQGLNAHTGEGMENEHGLLAWEFPEIEKKHVPSLSQRLLAVRDDGQ
jgi:hypothetical protein